MTWDAQRTRMGREPVVVVELDLDYCGNNYGVAPCTATYFEKCYNTYATCRDKLHFTKTTKTYRFSSLVMDPASNSIPSVVSATYAPTKLDPAKGLGIRASVTIVIGDHTHNDVGIDPYVNERSYQPMKQGTFWGRLIARNKYYLGRIIRVKTGYLVNGVFDNANFSTSVYVIDKIDGPNTRGQVTITAKDLLKLADDEKAKVPVATTGLLTSNINATGGGTFSITAGKGAMYAASGTVRIGSELITYTRATDLFTIVSRATDGTTIEEHKIGDTVQDCVRYTNTKAHLIVYDILVNKVGIPSTYINLPDWTAEADVWLADTNFSAILSDPEGANTLITELAQQATFYIWWDERAQLIRLRAIRPAAYAELKTLTDYDGIIADTAVVTMKPEERISQVWVHYGIIDPTVSNTEVTNYKQLYVQADLGAEGVLQYGQQAIAQYFSRWIPTSNPNPPTIIATRALNKFKDTPRYLKIQIDAKDANIWTGDTVLLSTDAVQDATGRVESLAMQVVEARETKAGTTFELTLTDTYFTGRYCYIMEDGSPSFDTATVEQRNTGGFLCNDSLVMSDGSEGYKII